MPERIQRRRTAGWHTPEGAVPAGPWTYITTQDLYPHQITTRARVELAEARRRLAAIRDARAHACDEDGCDKGGCDFDFSAFVDRVDEILATGGAESDLIDALNRVVFDRDPDCGCTPPCGHDTYQTAAVPGSPTGAQATGRATASGAA